MIALAVIAFGVAWWLGLYVFARDPRKPVLRRTGAGLLAYAAALACEPLREVAGRDAAEVIGEVRAALLVVPALAWTGVILQLLPEAATWRDQLDRGWRRAYAPAAGVALALALADAVADPGPTLGSASVTRWILAGVALVPLAGALALLVAQWRTVRPAPARGVLAVASLLFTFGAAALLLPLDGPFPDWLLLSAVGADLALLGLAVAVFDAFAEGETLRADMRRSALTAAVTAVLFGSQVGLAIALGTGATLPLTALLLGIVAAAITVPVLGGPLAGALDRAAFPADPSLQQSRADLRGAADALAKRAGGDPILALDDAEFTRLTRRALAHYGDLGKLVSSPLTALPVITERLAARSVPDQPLERATELKALLLESILRLKPRDGEFGITDEWRFYNALYFSYVVGIRPYSRRARHDGLDPDARRALQWFAAQVPERTLYNWQNAAAKLVAADLRGYVAPR